MGQCNKSLLGLGLALVMRVPTSEASTPPKLRLGTDVRPAAQSLDLTLVPGRAAFTGTSTIEVEVQAPTRTIWLNATGITVGKAEVTSGGSSQPATLVPGGTDFLGLGFARAVPRGRSTLRLEYSGKISDSDSAGVFQGKDGDDLYVFTQFEATLARRAFPCFDEPGFKNPWNLTVHVKKEHLALSNTNAISEVDEPGGMKKVVFAPTPPLPSYLVAFAIGPFEIVDGGVAGIKKTPIRIVTPRGKAREARYAAEVTGPILDAPRGLFRTPVPVRQARQPGDSADLRLRRDGERRSHHLRPDHPAGRPRRRHRGTPARATCRSPPTRSRTSGSATSSRRSGGTTSG